MVKLNFSDDERKFMRFVADINDVVDNIFDIQKGRERGVYPTKIVKKDLAPLASYKHRFYSIVKTKTGKLKAVPYNKMYKKELGQINILLEEILKLDISKNIKKFCRCIQASFQDNNWQRLADDWKKIFSEKDFFIWNFGPIAAYADKKFWTKKLFSSFLLVRHSFEDERVDKIMKNIDQAFDLDVLRGSCQYSVKLIGGKIIDRGGGVRVTYPVGLSRSNDSEKNHRMAVKQLFLNRLNEKINKIYIPLVTKFMVPYEREELYDFFQNSYHICVLLHELGHTIGKFPKYLENRFGSYYKKFEEIRAESSSYILADFFEKKGILEKGFVQKMMMANLLVYFHMRYIFQKTRERGAYQKFIAVFLDLIQDQVDITPMTRIFFHKKDNEEYFLKQAAKIMRISRNGDLDAAKHLLDAKEESKNMIDAVLKKFNEEGVMVKL